MSGPEREKDDAKAPDVARKRAGFDAEVERLKAEIKKNGYLDIGRGQRIRIPIRLERKAARK